MREFKIEEANNSHIVTRDGKSVRIICTDHYHNKYGGPIIALVKAKGSRYEAIVQYNRNGQQVNRLPEYDLFIDD